MADYILNSEYDLEIINLLIKTQLGFVDFKTIEILLMNNKVDIYYLCY